MKVTIERVNRLTLEEFANKHGLEMVVTERTNGSFYASFRRFLVKEGCMRRGVYGDGKTPEEAIKNYAPQISQHVIVDDNREILVPCLI